ncbi:two-component system nitrogen regulation sensor histidine kinase NtrY [Novosphingobium chloroacetimidivorans]|uniref:histidine kinase n=1 Tax=Novosphingobium chloroacetimidivorans TaxID=1428314 RepID=A0A7W7NU42_9SPHN|nr:ATP-binding protein [Novosphingobium chloroacetimidivorans]MBB4856791.1 two-component system nitrogen regulation sensor histidine kinase NtrY [Novosphingobium chloroacetimidivorans]
MQLAARKANFFGIVTVVSVVAFLIMTSVTFVALFRNANNGEFLSSNMTATLLVGTLVPALAILVLLGRWMALRRAAQTIGGNGRMHVRLVFIFSVIAAVPTLLVVIFASYLFQSGVEFWFSDNSRGLLENANKLARGYYEQAQRDVSQESLAMASDLRGYLSQESIGSAEFPEFLAFQVRNRRLDESAILQKGPNGQLLTPAIVNPTGDNETAVVKPGMIRRIDAGEPFVVEANANRIVALTPIDRASGVYLYTSRSSDLLAFSQGQRAENIVRGYEMLTSRARLYQLRFNIALFIAALALVGLSVWLALRFADRQVKPLYELVDAARRVGSGNFALRVEGRTGADEMGLLNRAFNRMTAQIEKQTQALLGANMQLQERRAFIEAVLESVTSGIISVDAQGAVLLMNSTAQKLLLDRAVPGPLGVPLSEIAPQMAALVSSGKPGGVVQYNKGSELLTLAVKIARDATGYVITFEDITRQLLDQRQAAWSDVARRIAHEIKNPLTPIQLATERLSRRYRKQISEDPELFEDLTRTIIRQVGDLRKMVDEFSSFARLPKPIFRPEDPAALTRQALFLQEVARTDIAFDYESVGDVPMIDCDRHQFGQAMTNVLKNAVEAIDAKAKDVAASHEAASYEGRIDVRLEVLNGAILVRITDNGIGLPQDRDRIIEPYVTTREKGTGLGLAIVNKIVEEHGGEMTFTPAQGGGTTVTMRFAVDPLAPGSIEQGRNPEAAE